MKLIRFAAFILFALAVSPSSAFAQSAGASGFGSFMPFIIIIVFFYLFLIRPQQKRAKEHKNKVLALKKGDKIITTGAIYAEIASVEETFFKIKIAEGVNVKISKDGVADVLQSESEAKVPEIVKR